MKKIVTLLFISIFAFTSCSDDGAVGPQGPQGPEGPEGEPGPLGQVIDVVGDFTATNDYSLLVDFNAEGIEVFESDAVLVYLKTGEDGTAGGAPVEVFRMLPQTYFIGNEILQYNYDFTFFNVLIFLDGTVDFGTLDASYRNDQVLRIVVVPGEFAETSGVDMSNMKAVIKALDIEQKEITKMKL
ncbi:collagen-like protein [Gillisia sp. Q332]|uniref:collagen-like protein n=1 Tax=Gillisia xinjiangensis TaxID=3384765 RepID=UPI00391CDFB8